MSGHWCLKGEWTDDPGWGVNDAQGLYLCKVCDRCEQEKLSRYRPEILSGYGQADVDEPIEDEEGSFNPDYWGGGRFE